MENKSRTLKIELQNEGFREICRRLGDFLPKTAILSLGPGVGLIPKVFGRILARNPEKWEITQGSFWVSLIFTVFTLCFAGFLQ